MRINHYENKSNDPNKGNGSGDNHGRNVTDPAGRVRVVLICKNCAGSGYVAIRNGDDYRDCPACHGSGKA